MTKIQNYTLRRQDVEIEFSILKFWSLKIEIYL